LFDHHLTLAERSGMEALLLAGDSIEWVIE
jgi:hypothetical protein